MIWLLMTINQVDQYGEINGMAWRIESSVVTALQKESPHLLCPHVVSATKWNY